MSSSASSFTGSSSDCTTGTPVSSDSPIRENIAAAVRRVRETTPLAQSFTNFVTINLVANAQLAAGGTAAMSFLPDDVIETAKIAGANYINVARCCRSIRTRCLKSRSDSIIWTSRGCSTRWPQASGVPAPLFFRPSRPLPLL